jgi:hypothetical protein
MISTEGTPYLGCPVNAGFGQAEGLLYAPGNSKIDRHKRICRAASGLSRPERNRGKPARAGSFIHEVSQAFKLTRAFNQGLRKRGR